MDQEQQNIEEQENLYQKEPSTRKSFYQQMALHDNGQLKIASYKSKQGQHELQYKKQFTEIIQTMSFVSDIALNLQKPENKMLNSTITMACLIQPSNQIEDEKQNSQMFQDITTNNSSQNDFYKHQNTSWFQNNSAQIWINDLMLHNNSSNKSNKDINGCENSNHEQQCQMKIKQSVSQSNSQQVVSQIHKNLNTHGTIKLQNNEENLEQNKQSTYEQQTNNIPSQYLQKQVVQIINEQKQNEIFQNPKLNQQQLNNQQQQQLNLQGISNINGNIVYNNNQSSYVQPNISFSHNFSENQSNNIWTKELALSPKINSSNSNNNSFNKFQQDLQIKDNEKDIINKVYIEQEIQNRTIHNS